MLVGPQRAAKNFMVHKDIICAHSKFFAAACSELWIEGQRKVVQIRDHEPKTFQAYMVWLSTRTILVQAEALPEDTESRKRMCAHQNQLIDLYLLGDFIDDSQLRNNVVMALVDLRTGISSPSYITRIWNSTLPGNPLRRMYIDKTIMRADREHLIGRIDQHPAGFIQDLTAALLRQTPAEDYEKFAARRNEYLESGEEGVHQTKCQE